MEGPARPAQIRISHSPSFSLFLSASCWGSPTLCLLTVREPMTSAGPSHHQRHVSCMCSKWAFLPFCKKNKLELDPNKHDRKNNNPCRGLILKTADLSTPKPACAVDRSRSPSLIPRGPEILNLRTFHSILLCGDHRAIPSACAGHCQRPFPPTPMLISTLA